MELKRGCSQIFLSLCSLERSFTICQCHSTFARLKSKQAGTFHNTSTDTWSLLSYIHLCKLSKSSLRDAIQMEKPLTFAYWKLKRSLQQTTDASNETLSAYPIGSQVHGMLDV